MKIDISVPTQGFQEESEFGYPPIDEAFGSRSPIEIELFDGATTFVDLDALLGGVHEFSVEGEYTNRFWGGQRYQIWYQDGDKEKVATIVTTQDATYSGGRTFITCENKSAEDTYLPTGLLRVRVWLDCPNWSGDLVSVASCTKELADHSPYLVFPLKTIVNCYSNTDTKVPESSLYMEYDESNLDRWIRKPIPCPQIQYRDNEADKRWYEGIEGFFNFDIQLKRNENSIETDGSDVVDQIGKLKSKIDYTNSKYKLLRYTPPVAIAISEIGSQSLGHYIYIYKDEADLRAQKYATDTLPGNTGIFYHSFDTSDTTNYIVTKELSYTAESIDGKIIKPGHKYEVYLFPKRWAYEAHTREFEVLSPTDPDSVHSLIIPVTCNYNCTGSMPAAPNADGGHSVCDATGGITGLNAWGPIWPIGQPVNPYNRWWNINALDDSDCIDWIINSVRAAIIQSTNNSFLLAQAGQVPYQVDQFPGFGPYSQMATQQVQEIFMDPFTFTMQVLDRSCTGCHCFFDLFWCYCPPCNIPDNAIENPEYFSSSCGDNACNQCQTIVSTSHVLFRTTKSKQVHRFGLWYDRFPHEIVINDIVDSGSGFGLDFLVQDQVVEENGKSGLNSLHLVSAIVDPAVAATYHDTQGQYQGLSVNEYVKLRGNPSARTLTRIWQKIAGVLADPNDVNTKIPTVNSSDFWTTYGPPAYNPNLPHSMWDNFPFGVALVGAQPGDICAIIRRKNSDEIFCVWRKTVEDITPNITPRVGDYTGHITSFESWNQGEVQDGDMDMFREPSTIYDDEATGMNFGLGTFTMDCVDQFTGTEGRVKTDMGRELDDTLSGDKVPAYASCNHTMIYLYENVNAGNPAKTKATAAGGSFALPAPIVIMLSKKRTL